MKVNEIKGFNQVNFAKDVFNQIRQIDFKKEGETIILFKGARKVIVKNNYAHSQGKEIYFTRPNCAINWAICCLISQRDEDKIKS